MTHTEVGFRKTPTNTISQGSFVIATSSCPLKDITVGLFMLLPYPYTLSLPYTLHPFRRPYSQCLCMPYPQSNPDAPSFSDLHHIKYYVRYICVSFTHLTDTIKQVVEPIIKFLIMLFDDVTTRI